MNDDKIIEPKITKRFNNMCMEWAYEAYKLDSRKSIRFYYDLFIERAKTKYFRQVFKEGEAIET